jgi:N-acetyl-gamma-glutamyl-phosphate reductase
MIKISVVGATGYAGAELVRILSKHPRLKLFTLFQKLCGAKDVRHIRKLYEYMRYKA